MKIKLFDVQAGFCGIARGERKGATVNSLLASMKKYDIENSLCRIFPDDQECDFSMANKKLYDCCSQSEHLFPCPIVMPNSACDVDNEETQCLKALENNALAVKIRPHLEYWDIAPWSSDTLLNTLCEHQLPLLLDTQEISLLQIGELASRFPALPVIMYHVSYGNFRKHVALLRAFENIYLSIGNCFTTHMGIEHIVKHAGATRMLFGTHFPVSEEMCAITQLMYAKISNEEKQLIGHLNFARLTGGIVK